MIKIYYSLNGDFYTFKFFLHSFLIVSGIRRLDNMVGNKKRSGKISTIFMNSFLYNSTGKTTRTPELKLWDEYLRSFQISEKELIKWIDNYKPSDYFSGILKELKNKINESLAESRNKR